MKVGILIMNEQKEAVIVLSKCGEVHKTFGIRAEKAESNRWLFTWAFPIRDDSAKREGYDKSTISGNIEYTAEYPGCPYCSQKYFTVCSCGHICCTILRNGIFTCEWCGAQGTIGEYGGESIKAGEDR